MPDPILIADALPARKMTRAFSPQELRALVLKHPDLADRLTPDPVKHPEQWMGFIPPLMDNTGRHWEVSKSVIRNNLVATCREAVARAHGTAVADDWYKDTQTDHWSDV